MLQSIPGVADVPGVRLSHVIGDQERRRREAEVGKDGIGVAGEGGVAVVEGQQKRAWCVVRRAWLREFVQRQCVPAGAGERGHLPRKDRPAHARDAQLERAADAVITEDRRARRQCGQSHPNTAQVTSAKITPSTVDLSVIAQDRRYQIDICHSASV